MTNDEQILFDALEKIALSKNDGHLTILRFTTNWRVGFETPDVIVGYPKGHEKLRQDFYEGKTFREAALKAIVNAL